MNALQNYEPSEYTKVSRHKATGTVTRQQRAVTKKEEYPVPAVTRTSKETIIQLNSQMHSTPFNAHGSMHPRTVDTVWTLALYTTHVPFTRPTNCTMAPQQMHNLQHTPMTCADASAHKQESITHLQPNRTQNVFSVLMTTQTWHVHQRHAPTTFTLDVQTSRAVGCAQRAQWTENMYTHYTHLNLQTWREVHSFAQYTVRRAGQ